MWKFLLSRIPQCAKPFHAIELCIFHVSHLHVIFSNVTVTSKVCVPDLPYLSISLIKKGGRKGGTLFPPWPSSGASRLWKGATFLQTVSFNLIHGCSLQMSIIK